ncbi:signal transducer and activator of transcription 5B [Hyalella azteca]|uniref:Signal transducer and transcription activator n=1 Tax=Hyalella azteca TaxID=294128 RepID=A0A8B7NI85_HYAAZ|nr:signal transducer and activator of transcription 5B [Hyalella azteca]
MTLWAKTQQLPEEAQFKVKAAYREHQFPIEVRHYMAAWIEDKMQQWSEVDISNAANVQLAQALMSELLQEIECKLKHEQDFPKRTRLEDAVLHFTAQYSNNPLALISIMRTCLNIELNLVRQHEMNGGAALPPAGGSPGVPTKGTHEEIMEQLAALTQRTNDTANDVRFLEQEQESFCLHYHNCAKTKAQLAHLSSQLPMTALLQDTVRKLERQKQSEEQDLSTKVNGLIQKRMALVQKLQGTLDALTGLQQRVLDHELISWKREQQMAGNGKPFDENRLNLIQEWCEHLAEIIWQTRHQIKECERQCRKLPLSPTGGVDLLPSLDQHVTRLLSSLVTSTFIIEKEPTQVLKTNTKFQATVRLLVGGKLNVYMTPPQVSVSIINEQQANMLLKNDLMGKDEQSGEILNCTGTMEYTQTTRQLSVSFRNMQLRKIKRAEKKGTECVMDEKFALLFQSQFSVGGGELVFQVWTLSLPVVVIVHGNQEPHAWATILWDNAFSEQGRVLFTVPDKYKLNPDLSDYSGMSLSWAQFCKEPLPLQDRNFTFWEWFFQIRKVRLGVVLRRPVAVYSLVGVVGCWTFFLQTPPSGLDIDMRDVFMLQPFTSKDFSIRSLADRISDLEYLNYLYPNIPKDKAFSRYYTPAGDCTRPLNGYVRANVVTHVPGFPRHGGMGDWSSPSTPAPVGSPPPHPGGAATDQTSGLQMQLPPGVFTDQEFLETIDGLPDEDFSDIPIDFLNAINFNGNNFNMDIQ